MCAAVLSALITRVVLGSASPAPLNLIIGAFQAGYIAGVHIDKI